MQTSNTTMRVLILLSLVTAGCSLEITTRLGNITGYQAVRNDKTFYSFYGIPYAKPPVGNRRFMKPAPHGRFESHDGTKFGNICTQMNFNSAGIVINGHEDCLILNVQTPSLNETDLKPVMVWIHGGGLTIGSANEYPGDVIVTDKEVVYVAINYRLGMLGFPPVNDDAYINNNLGFWDQHLALQWIKENIDEYGGDKSKITIFGESAGGTSVMSLVWSPHSNRTLFQRAIGQSSWFDVARMLKPSSLQEVSSIYNCSSENLVRVMSCLRRADAATIINLPLDLLQTSLGPMMMMNSEFLPQNFFELMKATLLDRQGRTKPEELSHIGKYDVMFGWNDNDGLVFLAMLGVNSTEMSDDSLNRYMQTTVVGLKDANILPFVSNLIKQTYKQSIKPQRMRELTNLTHNQLNLEIWKHLSGDLGFSISAIRTLRLHELFSSNTRAYSYELSMKSSYDSLWPVPDWLRVGANHGDDIVLVFGFSRLDLTNRTLPIYHDGLMDIRRYQNLTADEERLSKVFLDYWTSFAANGAPVTNEANREWLEYGSEHRTALITANSTRSIDDIRKDTYNMMTGLDSAIAQHNKLLKTTIKQTTDSVTTAQLTSTRDAYQYSNKSPLSADQMYVVMIVVTVTMAALFVITLTACIKTRVDLNKLRRKQEEGDISMN